MQDKRPLAMPSPQLMIENENRLTFIAGCNVSDGLFGAEGMYLRFRGLARTALSGELCIYSCVREEKEG